MRRRRRMIMIMRRNKKEKEEQLQYSELIPGTVVIKLSHVSLLIVGYEKHSVIDVTHEHVLSFLYSTSHMYAAK